MSRRCALSQLLLVVLALGVLCPFEGSAAGLPWISEGAVRSAVVTVPPNEATGFETMPPASTGIHFTNRLADRSAGYNQVRMNGSGVALGDVDGDGWCDLYLCGLESPNRLFRNLGGWRFEDITRQAGVECLGQYSTGAAFADLDGDGDVDLIVNSIDQGTRLLFNNGKGVFAEQSSPAMRRPAGGMSLAIADFDGDRDLDLYLVNYRTNTIRSTGFGMIVTAKGQIREEYRGQYEVSSSGRLLENGEPDALFLNDGTGHFDLASWTDGRFADEDGKPLGAAPRDWGLSAFAHDFDGDGSIDLYVCNDFWSPDRLWLNDGKGRFRAAPRLMLRHTSNFSMGMDVADIDRDGRDDFIVLDMLSLDQRRRARQRAALGLTPNEPYRIDSRPQIERNTLFWNRGDGTYAEVAQQAGLAASEWSWGAVFLDVDLDGYEDLLVTNGHLFDMLDDDIGLRMAAAPRRPLAERLLAAPRLNVPNVAFRNRGDRSFEEVGARWGFAAVGVSHGIATADLDQDGDLDIVVNSLNAGAIVLRNRASEPRVGVRLRGNPPNTAGIGARLRLLGGPVAQSQTVICGGRYLSSDEGLRVFAAGSPTNVLRLEIRWPDGTWSEVDGLRANRLYVIDEGLSVKRVQPASDSPALKPAWFADVSDRLAHRHNEKSFEEFGRQPLLSRRNDTLGPGVSWIDWDGDGFDDLLIGAARGGHAGVLRNDGHGGFVRSKEWEEGLLALEDQTSLLGWFPARSNGCLIVASTGYELAQPPTNQLFRFDEKLHALEPLLAAGPGFVGPLAMADIDRDGQLDLFVGGHALPGQYPRASGSLLLVHQGSGWIPAPQPSAPFDGMGLINGAVFADLDQDGFPDLICASEWGPVQVWKNERGQFTNRTHELGLDRYLGWWNGVTVGDFDGDGRLDLVASNWGRNTAYEPFLRGGIRAFMGELSGRGGFEFLEAVTDPARGVLVPWRDRKLLSRAMPWLQERFSSAESFSESSLTEVIGPGLGSAQQLTVNWLDSTVFLNRADRFEPIRLPWEAQSAPAFGVCVGDFDGDGREDLFLAQNFFGVEETVARYDGGRGLLLRGDGTGGFVAVGSRESGLAIDGEQRGAAVADFDGDGRLDLAVGQNQSATRLFRNLAAPPGLRVRLRGSPGNPLAFGAQLRARYGDRLGPVRELHCGSGFLSLDSAVTVLPLRSILTGLQVRWPDGSVVEADVPSSVAEVILDARKGLQVVR